MDQVHPSPPFQGMWWFPNLSPTKGIGISPGFPQSCLSAMLLGVGDWSGVWLQDLGYLVCVFAGLGGQLGQLCCRVKSSSCSSNHIPVLLQNIPCASTRAPGVLRASAASSDPSSLLPAMSLAAANPGMKSQGEPGLAESLGQAWRSHLAEGSSKLEPLQGPFLSVTSPQSARAGGWCGFTPAVLPCQIPPGNTLRSRLSPGSGQDTWPTLKTEKLSQDPRHSPHNTSPGDRVL